MLSGHLLEGKNNGKNLCSKSGPACLRELAINFTKASYNSNLTTKILLFS